MNEQFIDNYSVPSGDDIEKQIDYHILMNSDLRLIKLYSRFNKRLKKDHLN